MNPARPTILVIEDEGDVCALVCAILGDAGFAVTTAADGLAALATLDQQTVDLAIVDPRLPGAIDGLETVRRARARHPDLKALFVSGVVPGPIRCDRGRDDFVAKPFSNREFLGCVFELLLRDNGDPGHRLAAEFGISEAKISCLRERRGAALKRGDSALAEELDRDIAEQLSTRRPQSRIAAARHAGAAAP